MDKDAKHEGHYCPDCDKTIYGNGEVYLIGNTTYCLKCYHKNHEGEE